MSNKDIERKVKRFFNGRGFYLVLSLCLLSIITTAILTANSVTKAPVDPGISGGSGSSGATHNVFDPVSGVEPDTSSAPEGTGSGTDSRPDMPSRPDDKDPSGEPSVSGPESPTVNPGFPDVSYKLPLDNEITESFSGEELFYSETLGDWRSHLAIDIKGEKGDKVRAAADGTVDGSYFDELLGNVVVLLHADGIKTVYAGLDGSFTLKNGDSVKQGDSVGRLSGQIPLEAAAGTHLHFEVIEDGKQVNPLDYLDIE